MVTLNQAPLNKKLLVRSFAETEERDFSEIESRLMLLGFLDGQPIRLSKKAPLFNDPFLVEVRGRMVALSRDEALLILVEVAE